MNQTLRPLPHQQLVLQVSDKDQVLHLWFGDEFGADKWSGSGE